MKTWFKIEWLCPAERAIGGKGFWWPLNRDDAEIPYRENDEARAIIAFRTAQEVHGADSVRLVRVTEEVVDA